MEKENEKVLLYRVKREYATRLTYILGNEIMQGFVAEGKQLRRKGATAAGLESNIDLLIYDFEQNLRSVADVETFGDDGRLLF
jgi:hypothetical protein